MHPRFNLTVRSVFLSVVLFFACMGPASAGWNPIKDIKNAAGSIVRGIGDIFGQGIAGLAGPTISDTANAVQGVIDKSLGRVESIVNNSLLEAERIGTQLLAAADVSASAKIAEFNSVMSVQIENVDQVLQARLVQVDEILANRIGSADIIATKQISNAEETLVSVVRYSSLVMLVAVALVILFYFALSRWKKGGTIASLGGVVAVGAVLLGSFAFVALIASWLLRPPSQERIIEIADQLVSSYSDATSTGDLDSAIFFASQYSAIEATALHPRFLVQFAELQRSLLRRSALFTSDEGRRELGTKVAQMSRTWDVVVDHLPPRLMFLRYEVPATTAMISWQLAQTIEDQKGAGCVAVGALRMYDAQPDPHQIGRDASPFLWLSASYVRWLQYADPSFDNNACGEGDEQFPKGADVTATVDKFLDGVAEAPPTISSVIKYNIASADFFRVVTLAYSTLAVADAQFRNFKTPNLRDTQRAQAKALSDQAADRILTAYNNYVATLSSIPDLAGQNIVLSTVGLPLGVVARAQRIRNQVYTVATPAEGQPVDPDIEILGDRIVFEGLQPIDPNNPPAGVIESDDCKNTFASIRPLFNGGAFRALCVNQKAIDEKLVQFEGELEGAFAINSGSAVTSNPALIRLSEKYKSEQAMLTLVANLPACFQLDTAGVGGWNECKNPPPDQIVRFFDFLVNPNSAVVSTPQQAMRISMAR